MNVLIWATLVLTMGFSGAVGFVIAKRYTSKKGEGVQYANQKF